VTVVGEFPTLVEAREADLHTDAFVVASADRALTDPASSTSRDPAPRVVLGDQKASVREPADIEPLTLREIEVLERLAEGLPNKAIAAQLGISDQMVKFHVASITSKLGAANRTEAVRIAVRGGIITI